MIMKYEVHRDMCVYPVLPNFPSVNSLIVKSVKRMCAQEVFDRAPPFKACGNSHGVKFKVFQD